MKHDAPAWLWIPVVALVACNGAEAQKKAEAAKMERDVAEMRAEVAEMNQKVSAHQAELAAGQAKAEMPKAEAEEVEAAAKAEAAEAAKAEAAMAEATTPAVGVQVGKWRLESATWSDGGAAGLTEAPTRSIGACLRTVKKKRAEVVIAVAAGEIRRAEVKGESLKCVDELRGVDTPEIGRDGEFTAIFVQ